MNAPLLLDTCALVWSAIDSPQSRSARAVLRDARAAGVPVRVSPISAWELGLLAARGRIAMTTPVKAWFDEALRQPGVELADMPPDVLIASTELPGDLHGDPADRIIIATAREYGLRIVTRDRRILDYAGKGHVMATAC